MGLKLALLFIALVALCNVRLQAQDAISLGVIGVSRGEEGITIARLTPDGPAEGAGLQVGDIIIAINGKAVQRVSEQAELFSKRPEGSSVRVSYLRGSRKGEAVLLLSNSAVASATGHRIVSEQSGISLPIRVSPEVSQGLLAHKIQPVYPPLAMQARVQGPVVLEAVISETGSIESLRVVSGHPMLIEPAMEAVKQWQYRPFYVNGRPTEVETQITLSFSLSGAAVSESLGVGEMLAEPRPPLGSSGQESPTRTQTANDELSTDRQVDLARDGVSMLQNQLKDPDSLKLFEVLVISSPHKYRGKWYTWYRGCIHYSATNSFGARIQGWNSFQINSCQSGAHYYVSSSNPHDDSACELDKKKDTVLDVTEQVEKP